MSRSLQLLVLCLALSGFLLWMVWDNQQARSRGTEIILDMQPIDPRSLFRGHYVIISTPLHQIEAKDFPNSPEFRKGQKIFIALTQETKGDWVASSLHKQKPAEEVVFIQGRIVRALGNANTLKYWVSYNIESYFSDKKTALGLEKSVAENQMRVILSVDKNGKAVIRGLEINGTRQIDRL